MTFQDLQTQARQLPDADKWQLVRILLDELQQPTITQNQTKSETNNHSEVSEEFLNNLDPRLRKLVGIAKLEDNEDPKEAYINSLEEKYS
ncbi:hypothetical protein IQ225_17900 [Synechocystis salina LEGE 06155]|nr:hypothetical protein [Synechocystis salina LEGE 06155]